MSKPVLKMQCKKCDNVVSFEEIRFSYGDCAIHCKCGEKLILLTIQNKLKKFKEYWDKFRVLGEEYKKSLPVMLNNKGIPFTLIISNMPIMVTPARYLAMEITAYNQELNKSTKSFYLKLSDTDSNLEWSKILNDIQEGIDKIKREQILGKD